MLEIINRLKPFLEDCYSEIGVREYSRIMNVSPPTASRILKDFVDEDLLKSRTDRGYLFFRANRDSFILRDFSRIYWRCKLKKLFEYIDSELHSPSIVLFGSLSKLEARENSDIDIAVISKTANKLNLEKFEKEYKRKIQLFLFKSFDKINRDLKKNIINGHVIQGEID